MYNAQGYTGRLFFRQRRDRPRSRGDRQGHGRELYEIRPAQPYTPADLDWTDKKSRSSVEMEDPACRPAIAGGAVDMAKYDTIFLGFPIWWYVEPRIVDTFMDKYGFAGKTVIPFATSGGSGVEGAVRNMERRTRRPTGSAASSSMAQAQPPGAGHRQRIKREGDAHMKSKVYFTRTITPGRVVEIYHKLGIMLPGKVAVKVHTGEQGNQNFLRRNSGSRWSRTSTARWWSATPPMATPRAACATTPAPTASSS